MILGAHEHTQSQEKCLPSVPLSSIWRGGSIISPSRYGGRSQWLRRESLSKLQHRFRTHKNHLNEPIDCAAGPCNSSYGSIFFSPPLILKLCRHLSAEGFFMKCRAGFSMGHSVQASVRAHRKVLNTGKPLPGFSKQELSFLYGRYRPSEEGLQSRSSDAVAPFQVTFRQLLLPFRNVSFPR